MPLSLFFILIISVSLVVLAALFTVFLFYTIVWGHIKGAPFVPSNKEKVRIMIELADIHPGEVVYDLGSGDGILLMAAARRGADTRGVEINPFLVWYTRLRAWIHHVDISIVRKDFRDIPLHDADVVFLYLWPSTNASLREKLLRELRPGSRIVSNAFYIEGLTPEISKNNIHVYRI